MTNLRGVRRFGAVLGAALLVAAPAFAGGLEECHPRGGWPNVLAKLQAGGEVRIAYLGGSITAADGWRVLSRDWLATQYPKARVTGIDAAISGTGAEFGACRLERDVLQHTPDLLFVEFAVNGAGQGDRAIRSMEGIVRHARQHDPKIDLCFVYTVSVRFLKDLQADRLPEIMSTMEKVAEHYGVSSILLGLEAARKVKDGSLVFQGASSHADGKVVFSGDGTHPFPDTGHPLYLAAIQRSLPALKAAGSPGPHALPAPLDAGSWEGARMIPLEDVQKSAGWTKGLPAGDAYGARMAAQQLPSVWQAAQPGEALTFTFKGTGLGLAGLRTADSGQFAVTIDDRPPVKGTLFDSYAVPGRYRVQAWFLPGELPDGEHRARIELLSEAPNKAAIRKNAGGASAPEYGENRLYLGAALIIGATAR